MPKTATDGLTDEQARAFDLINEALTGEPGRRHALLGFAGTGKTYLGARLAEALREADVEVKICAPTHQATTVLAETLGVAHREAQTIHSVLGLRLTPDGEGGYRLEPDGTASLPEPGGVVLCDEASMIGRDLWAHIEKTAGVSWLFLGDPAQLPPVGEDPSPALSQPGACLNEIVRQERDNPIVEVGRRLREGEPPFDGETVSFEDGKGVAITRSSKAFLETACRLFDADGRADGRKARVLAYRNRRVQAYNQAIRRTLYGADAVPYVEGEWLVAHDTYFESGFPVVVNSQLFQIEEAHRERDELALGGQWLTWRLTVQPAGERSRQIRVLDPSERVAYDRELQRLKQAALDKTSDGGSARKLWRDYYRLYEQYARVRYAYCSTVHKAQGSTYETTLVDWRDLRAAPPDVRRALRYVAVTRPRKRLAILR